MKRAVLCAAVLSLVAAIGPAPNAGAKAPSGYPLVYMSVRGSPLGDSVAVGGGGDVYLMRGLQSKAMRAANSNGHDCGPALAPGGDRLIFESNRVATSSYSPDNFELYLLNLKTGKLKQLTTYDGNDLFPAWSPDGRKIVFSREDKPRSFKFSLWTMNADGSALKRIVAGDGLFPKWSPDGRRIAYVSLSGGIDTVHPDGTHHRILSREGTDPDWSPDSKWIVFSSARGQKGPLVPGGPHDTALYLMRADGSDVRKLDQQTPGTNGMPSWSPDGRHIAYVHDEDHDMGPAMVTTPIEDGPSFFVIGVLPTGNGVEAWKSGPKPARVWEITLNASKKVVARRQLSNGNIDLFPHYSPVRNPL